MASLSTVRKNGIFKDFYTRLRARNKPAKVSLSAVSRKLVILINHLLKNLLFKLRSNTVADAERSSETKASVGGAGRLQFELRTEAVVAEKRLSLSSCCK